MQTHQRISRIAWAMLLLVTGLFPAFQSPAAAQNVLTSYKVTKLTSNQTGKANNTDPNLVNAWGLAFFTDSPFWVSDNGFNDNTGLSTLYDHTGTPLGLVVKVPPPVKSTNPGQPSGIVANGTDDFVVSAKGKSGAAAFIFSGTDGVISGWSPGVDPTNAILAVDNSDSGAVYTGLAMGSNHNEIFIFAADNVRNVVDIYDGSFKFVKSFTDHSLPAGFAPYGIQNIFGRLYVTFAPVNGKSGYVDVFDTDGKMLRRFASKGILNGPWGVALAPPNFGKFSNAILIGNNTDGTINAFNHRTGKFLGQLSDSKGAPIVIDNLWALQFGAGNPANGQKNELFFTAGPNNYAYGLFGMITAQ